MAIAAQCPECNAKFKVSDDQAGERVECPRCGATLTAPDEPEPAPRRKPALSLDDDERPRPSRAGMKGAPPARRR
jgi:predicted Zn finger-like uncharacterized protein